MRSNRELISSIALWAALAASAQTHQVPTDQVKQADTAFKAGYAALINNDLQTAREDFQKVIKLVPQVEEGHSALGAVLLQLNLYPEAITELKRALKLKPEDAAAQTNLALALAGSDRNSEALPLFTAMERKAAAQGQTLPVDILRAYARSLAATGQIEPAIAKMQQAVTQAPRDPALHDALGSLYAQKSDWAPAQDEFSTALHLDPDLAPAHLHLGVVFLNQQQIEAAVPEPPPQLDWLAKSFCSADLRKGLAAGRERRRRAACSKVQSRSIPPVRKHSISLPWPTRRTANSKRLFPSFSRRPKPIPQTLLC